VSYNWSPPQGPSHLHFHKVNSEPNLDQALSPKKILKYNLTVIMVTINSSNSIVWRILRQLDQEYIHYEIPQEHVKNQRIVMKKWP
jgi:hypothetical protein